MQIYKLSIFYASMRNLSFFFVVNTFESINNKVLSYRVSQKTWEFSDEFDIVFVMN